MGGTHHRGAVDCGLLSRQEAVYKTPYFLPQPLCPISDVLIGYYNDFLLYWFSHFFVQEVYLQDQ